MWNEGASIKHHAIICCGIVCFDSSLPLFPFGLELSKLSKSQVKKCLTFSSSVGYSWISCRLYRRFETCNCSTMMFIMIHLTDLKRLYIHAFAPYLQTNIIIECLCFRPQTSGKMDPMSLAHHMIFKKRATKYPGFWDCTSVDAWVM